MVSDEILAAAPDETYAKWCDENKAFLRRFIAENLGIRVKREESYLEVALIDENGNHISSDEDYVE